MEIVTIANQKGGVGKTTNTVNIAATLSLMGNRVLVVDGDPQAQAMQTFGIPLRSVRPAQSVGLLLQQEAQGAEVSPGQIAAAIFDCSKLLEDFDTQGVIHVLGAEQETFQTAETMIKSTGADGLQSLRRMLKRLDTAYDFAVVDIVPNLSTLAMVGWTAGDQLIASAIPESMCVQGTLAMKGVPKRVSNMTDGACTPRFLGTILTRALAPAKLDPLKRSADADAIITVNTLAASGALIYPKQIPVYQSIKRQTDNGVPAVLSDAGRAGRDYDIIVNQILDRMQTPEAEWTSMEPIDIPESLGGGDDDE
jgi:chromosome partitioning protein